MLLFLYINNNSNEYINKEKLSYDAILACYHDQGLIPIKSVASKKTVNMTIGLDVIRTSPAHGTAFDIAGKCEADENSMIKAIELALTAINEATDHETTSNNVEIAVIKIQR